MAMYLKQLTLGPMQNYVYVIGDTKAKTAAVVDPAWNVSAILDDAKAGGYTITHIVLTHGHYDHINGTEELAEKTGAAVCVQKSDLEELIYEGAGGEVIPRGKLKKIESGDAVLLGSLTMKMISTPGHTPGSQCLYIDTGAEKSLFTGDTLFVGTIGRCDFPYSSPSTLFKTLEKIKSLPDDTVFYPGHDYGHVPFNTLGKEKKTNPFLMANSLENFLQLIGR